MIRNLGRRPIRLSNSHRIIDQIPEIEGFADGSGNMRQRAVGLHETDKALGRRGDCTQGRADIFGIVGVQILRQRRTERRDRRDSIHDFMGKHTDEPCPRLRLIVFHLEGDVIEGHDADILTVKPCRAGTYGELHRSTFRHERRPRFRLRSTAEGIGQFRRNPLDLPERRDVGHAKEPARDYIGIVDFVSVDNDYPALHMVQHDAEITLPLTYVGLFSLENGTQPVQRLVQPPVRPMVFGIPERRLPAVQRIRHEVNLADDFPADHRPRHNVGQCCNDSSAEHNPSCAQLPYCDRLHHIPYFLSFA